jgi:hypothetical protein
MQLRTRLIVASTPLTGQATVRVGHEGDLSRAKCRIQRIDDLSHFVWWARLQVEYSLLRSKRCQFAIRPSALQQHTADLWPYMWLLEKCPAMEDRIESLARCNASNSACDYCKAWASQDQIGFQ